MRVNTFAEINGILRHRHGVEAILTYSSDGTMRVMNFLGEFVGVEMQIERPESLTIDEWRQVVESNIAIG